MSPTRLLVSEHLVIEQVLNCLERLIEASQRQRRLDETCARDVVIFLRAFAERCHQHKLESQVLPAVQAAGALPPRCLQCPMLHRHRQSREHLDAMEAAIEPAAAGNANAVRQFTDHGQAYIELLLEYIETAEDCLFPIINQTLSEADKSQLMTQLQNSRDQVADEHPITTYMDIANRLADQLNVPRAAIPGRNSS
jgi:hemerythrin-like domain-containing protein